METIILLHPFPLDSRFWDRVREPLSTHAELLAPDLPGWGGSPLPTTEPSLDTVAAEVVRLLDDRGLDRVTVVAAALGGYVLMAMLRLAPERVSRAVFTGTQAVADSEQARATRAEVVRRASAEQGLSWLADFMIPNLLTAEDPELRQIIEDQSPETVAWYAKAMAARPDARETLRALDLDALVVHGGQDPIMAAAVAEDIGHLTNAPVHFVDGAAHLPAFERPEAFLDLVVPWLTKH
ncbi:alpha/beta fold hydrolase [Actinokineospora pegani]|uniref:alpha/beta fold hydrolase n=1 Tax=Actinokineospora pegani TaxID=2654637 RepID=UPI0012EA9769|nr:alpha/beta fold hydrolase [Actinokineospora pegani]